MNNMQKANLSPRIVNGVLRWYEGNTFKLQLELELVDQDGEPVSIADTDSVEVKFRDKRKDVIKEFVFEHIEDNIISLDFDAECTALFPAGKYTFDLDYIGENRVTLINDSPAQVD